MRASLGAFAQVGTRTQVRTRATFGSIVDTRFDSDRFVNASAAANLRVGQRVFGPMTLCEPTLVAPSR